VERPSFYKGQSMAGGMFGLGDAMGFMAPQSPMDLQPAQVNLPMQSVGPSNTSVPGITDAPTIPATPPVPQGSIQDRFLGTLRDGGLTNPNGLGAVAAYAQRESRYSPDNITGSWSDPSQSGQAGTSGGILSWRADRLDNMRRFTAGASDPVAAQAQFLLQENPRLTQALQNAKSPEEANRLMADAWKFAGYNDPSHSEYKARLATTQDYVNKLGGGGSIGTTYGAIGGSAPAGPFVGSANPGMSVGSTALQGGFGLNGIQAYGAPVAGQSGAAGVSSLINQPMQGSIPKGDWSAPTEQTLLQKLLNNNSMSALGGAAGALGKVGGQTKQQQGGGGSSMGSPGSGPSPIGLQQAKSMFDPSRFFQALRSAGVRNI
jgi:hypothetical protein